MTDFVVLAAGKGERLWPITPATPKVLVRVLGKPVLEWLVEGVYPQAGKIIVVVGAGKEQVVSYFKNSRFAGKIVFVEQKEQLGTGHALLQAENEVQGDFVTFNGDNFFDPAAFAAIETAAKKKKHFVFCKKTKDAFKYGVFRAKNGFISEFEETPEGARDEFINLNCFFLPKSFFGFLKKAVKSPRGEIELPQAVLEFSRSAPLELVECREYWNDVGYFWNYLDANSFACEKLAEAGKEGAKIEEGVVIEGKAFVGKGTVVKSGSRLEGPAFIGADCVIGPNAFIRKGTVIEDNCHVGSSEIKASVIMRDSNVPHFSYVGDSVLCEDVNFAAGAITANLRFDGEPVSVHLKRKGRLEKFDSGRRKLGCVIGKGSRIGINASINPGVLIGCRAQIFPNSYVDRNVDDGAVFRG